MRSLVDGSGSFSLSAARGVKGCLALFGLALVIATGCGGSKCADGSCGGAGGSGGSGGSTASCTSTKGTISGTAYLDSAKTSVAAGADIVFVKAGDPAALELHGMSDAAGKFSVELDPGSWSVGGKDTSGCIPNGPVSVELTACEVEDVTLVFDTCPG